LIVQTGPEDVVWRSACAVSSALDLLGDKWSLLIIRDLVILGPRTYSDFRESPEGIATNILASRLKLLTSFGLIKRADPEGVARNNAYQLTTRGAALRPTLLELGRWSQTHLGDFRTDMRLAPLDT
jgi:DNA-binding HxlR family transcriptional regulator